MKIHKYGITLSRLKEKDIELVRRMRNSEEIQASMQFRETITPEMQKKWFESVNTIFNNYFIITADHKQIGLINGKNINFEKRTSEGGMFIWDKDYLGTAHGVLASVIMSDFNFLINEFEKNYIKILRSNQKAIAYNRQFGYVPSPDFEPDPDVLWMELSKDRYMENTGRLRKLLASVTHDALPLLPANFDFSDDSPDDLRRLYLPLPDYLKRKINDHISKAGISLNDL